MAAFGAGAAHKGLSLFEAMLSSGLVFAGAAQLVSLALWQDHWTFGSTLAITLVVFAGFSVVVLQEPMTINHAVGFGLILAGAYFVFRGPLS